MVTVDIDFQPVYPAPAELSERLARATHVCDIAEIATQLAAVGDARDPATARVPLRTREYRLTAGASSPTRA